MTSSDVPRLRCGRRSLAALSSDPAAAPRDGPTAQHLQENSGRARPGLATTVRARWDDAAWHLLFECEDPHPWATITERDGPLWIEEVVEVFFDPVGDLQSYFEIEVNPLNTVCDLVLRRSPSGWRKEFGWHCGGLSTSVQRTPLGWNAELQIPFAEVTDEPVRAGTVWRGNFFRIDRPKGAGTAADLSAWSPTFAPTFHRPGRFGVIEFC